MNNTPLISIIIPVYNSGKYLNESISSILNQTYSNWELILVDDKSNDDSVEVIMNHVRADDRITLIKHHTNQGVSKARNTALKVAKGAFIAFLDSDDTWDTNKLEHQLRFMLEMDAAISHTSYRKMDESGEILNPNIPVSKVVEYSKLLKHNEIGLSTSMINMSRIKNPSFDHIARTDYTFWLKLLKKGHVSYGIEQPLASYRIHPHSISYNKITSIKKTWQVYRNVEKLPIHRALYYFSCYAVFAGSKYINKQITS